MHSDWLLTRYTRTELIGFRIRWLYYLAVFLVTAPPHIPVTLRSCSQCLQPFVTADVRTGVPASPQIPASASRVSQGRGVRQVRHLGVVREELRDAEGG